MQDTYYATVKLVTGEEILAQVTPAEENGVEFVILSEPITVNQANSIDQDKGVAHSNLIPRKWLMYSAEDMVIVHMDKIITISEMDMFGIEFYKNALVIAKLSSPLKRKVGSKQHRGYLGEIEEARRKFEKIFNSTEEV